MDFDIQDDFLNENDEEWKILVQMIEDENNDNHQINNSIQQKNKTNTIQKINQEQNTDDDIFQSNLNKKMLQQYCPQCNSNMVVNDNNGYYVCQQCGITGDQINNKNYSKFNQSKNDITGYVNYDTSEQNQGIVITGGNYKLKIAQMWSQQSYKERSKKKILDQIELICKNNDIQKSICDNAKILYKNICQCKYIDGKKQGKSIIFRGINRKSVIAACVFYGSKLSGIPRTPKEIAIIFQMKVTKITKGIGKFTEYIRNSYVSYVITPIQPFDFIKRYYKYFKIQEIIENQINTCDDISKQQKYLKLKLISNEQHLQYINDIINNIKKLDLASDNQSLSIASAATYLYGIINDIDIKKKQLNIIFKTSEVTITKTFRKLCPFKNIICNNKLTEKIYDDLQNGLEVDYIRQYMFNDDIQQNKQKGRPKKILQYDDKMINITKLINNEYEINNDRIQQIFILLQNQKITKKIKQILHAYLQKNIQNNDLLQTVQTQIQDYLIMISNQPEKKRGRPIKIIIHNPDEQQQIKIQKKKGRPRKIINQIIQSENQLI